MELSAGLLLWAVFIVLVLLLVLAGAIYQAVGSARDARTYPPSGQMVEIGAGRRLHIYSTGKGSPTVVMDAGLPGSSLSWRLVQPEVAKFTRVCSYDRAGLGWSDPGSPRRPTQRIVEELRALLASAGIEGPYVLVGHSFGAFTARLFAVKYPDDVVGMVLVDPIYPSEWLQLSEEQQKKLQRAVRLCRRAAVVARLGIARLIAFLAQIGAARFARLGVFLVSGGTLKGGEGMFTPLNKLPQELHGIVRAFWIQPKFYQAIADQLESLPESAAQVAATADHGELPLVVLSAGNSGPARMAEGNGLARLSANGKHVVASKSGHWIHLDRRELVVEAIREVVELACRRR